MTLDYKTSTEESLVDELRHRMKEHMPQYLYQDDHFFLRFIRARNHNIDAAGTMLRNHMNFRRQYKLDSILSDFTPHKFLTSEYLPVNNIGTDLEGSRLTYFPIGNLDTKGILKSVKYTDILLFVIQFIERDLAEMQKTTKKTGKLVDKGVYIFDFENFSLTTATHKPTLEVFLNLLIMYDANYPETLKTAYAINASYYFTLMWTVLKPIVSGPTQKKIKMFGKTGWREDLLQHVSPDVLPVFLGGNRTDPDGNPMCKTLIRFGGVVPQSLFAYENKNFAARLPDAKKLTVNRLSKAEVTLQVLHPDSTVEWEFMVKHRDVGFAVLYSEYINSEAREVIPQQRIETSESTESGMCKCEKAGIYTIEFDNSYSWIHRKEIYYKVTVDLPCKNAIAS